MTPAMLPLLAGAVAAGDPDANPGAAAPVPSVRPDPTTARVLSARPWAGGEHVAPPAAKADPHRLPASRLVIPSLQVDAPIESAEAVAGSLVLPADASRVARYAASPPLAAVTGTTIVAGHVTNVAQVGALFPLATVRRGAVVHTTDDAGRVRSWQVASITAPLKADLPASIFTASGPRRLAIITCGGTATTHADGSRSYPRNIVVIATPLGEPE